MTRAERSANEFKYWVAIIAIIVLAITLTTMTFSEYKAGRIQELKQHYYTDVTFLKNQIQSELQSGNYETLDSFLSGWGSLHLAGVIELKLTSKNGYVLSSYIRESKSDQVINITEDITYSYNKAVVFEFTGDISLIDVELEKLLWTYGISILLFTVALVIITTLTLKKRRLSFDLQMRTTSLKRSNMELSRAIQIINESSATAFLWKNETDWPVDWVSENVKYLTGYSADEFIAGTIKYSAIILPEDSSRVSEEVLKASENVDATGIVHKPYRIITKAGVVKWVEDRSLILRDSESNITHYNGIVMDITERKQAEENQTNLEAQLRQSQKLEAVGTMAGGIAHDFNNILQGLYLYSSIIKDQLPEDEQLRANFQNIIDSSERAKELVSQILTFSRKGDEELKPTKVQYILKDALKLTRASTPTTIEINENIETNCAAVLCNATQVHQVFINLCNNAIHSMHAKGGTLSVSLQETDKQIETEPGDSASNESGFIELVVSDTGFGMDAKTLEQIFDPFFTTKSADEGTGLGLSIVHGIIKDMGGQIEVTSKPGKGTTFKILLPLSIGEEQQEEIQKETGKGLNGLCVLLVDDDTMISSAGKYILEDKGCMVSIANNGHEALELFQKDTTAYDLILTDLTMPRMTGLELGKAVRKLSKDILIVLTSGNLDPKLQLEFKKLGFNGFVRKPWTAPELLKVISSLDLDLIPRKPSNSPFTLKNQNFFNSVTF